MNEAKNKLSYSFDFLGKDTFPVLIYVGPTREYFCEYEKCTVKSLIRDEVFKDLSEMGVNVVCGHWETHSEMLEILDYCRKYRLVFLPRYDPEKFGYYDADKKGISVYHDLCEDQKIKARIDFTEFINKYKDHPAFGGVCTGDEPGIDLVPAYVEMKKIFDSICPNKLFYVNMFGPDSEGQPWLKYGPFADKATKDGLSSPGTLTWIDVIYNYANTVGLEVERAESYYSNIYNCRNS